MMIHEKKRESLLSWVKSAGGHDVEDLADLANGKLLSQLVIALSDEDSNILGKSSVAKKKENLSRDSTIDEIEINVEEGRVLNGYHDLCNDSSCITTHFEELIETKDASVSDSALSENNAANAESCDTVNGKREKNISQIDTVNENSNSNDPSRCPVSSESVVSAVQSHYDVVQKFIENMLELNACNLVDFSQCMNGNELEIAKLTVLLLSAMVQYSLSTKKNHIMASCYSLSADAQEEIMDSLELFLKDRPSPVERKEFHSRLSRCAKLRISPRKHVNVASTTTPSNKSRKRGRKRKAFNNEEYLDNVSPIQNLIKSPDIRHITPNSEVRLLEAVRCKDRTIALLTYDLDVEKYNVDDLKKQNKDLNLQLSKLRQEKHKLKNELDEVQTNLENIELEFERTKKEWKTEAKRYQNQIKDLKESENSWKDSSEMQVVQNTECACSEEIATLKCALQAKDDKNQELQKQNEILTVQVERLRRDLENMLSSEPVEKCFNISDLSLRNELREKCEELQNRLSELEVEHNLKTQELKELLSQKEEWKVKLHETDKEREDAINCQKKLEIQNSHLKGQIEVLKKVLSPSNDENQRGLLWHTYEEDASSTSHSNSELTPLIQNICKIVRENSILDTEVLLELQKFERDFIPSELVHVLTLLAKILKESSSGANTKGINNFEQLYYAEKKKVLSLRSKLKNCSSEEKLKKLEVELSKTKLLRDTYLERCRNITKNYELIKEELSVLKRSIEEEKPAPVIKTVVKTIPPPPCEICSRLSEKLAYYQQVKRASESQITSLNDGLKSQKSEIEILKKEILKLNKKRNELEEKLSVSASVYSPSLKTLREKLSESRFVDAKCVIEGSQRSENQNASSVTSCSFNTPWSDGFSRSSKRQTQLKAAFCKVEDEAEMLSESSIFERQRLYEINRRNTLCLPHLKSQYPLELNMTPSQHKYFQPPSSSIHLAKKRKISKPSEKMNSFASLVSSSRPSTSGSRFHHSTPKVNESFTQSMYKMNTSAARLQYRRAKSSVEK